MRPSKGNEFWQQGKQVVIFYDLRDELPVQIFENLWEIVDYKGWSRNKTNYDSVYSELLRALRSPDNLTRMLGRWMTVYLINIDVDTETS